MSDLEWIPNFNFPSGWQYGIRDGWIDYLEEGGGGELSLHYFNVGDQLFYTALVAREGDGLAETIIVHIQPHGNEIVFLFEADDLLTDKQLWRAIANTYLHCQADLQDMQKRLEELAAAMSRRDDGSD